ncbi:MAG TPA: VCBS repeat-containing protein, partial [Steroidobacter sp.]
TSSPAAIAVADYDNDNVDELFMGSIDGFSIYDLATESVEWEPPSPLTVPNSFATRQADMNGDSHADLVGLTQSGHVEIFDVHAQSLIWRSTLPTHRTASGFALSDLDNDGEPEIVVVLQDRIIIYGRGLMTFVERASIPYQNAAAVAVADLDGDSEQEIYVLNYPQTNVDSILNVFDADLQLLRSVDLGVTATALFVENSAFARKNLLLGVTGEIFTSPGYSELWAIDPITGADVWRSPPLVGAVSRDSLYFVDVDGDGDDEISFGNTYGMYHTR